jgi:fructokinase
VVVIVGELLLDCFPDYRRIGGAPFNVAFHLHHLDVPVRFLSRIGDDEAGKAILAFLNRHRFPTADIQIDADRPTGTVEVALGESGPSYHIVRNVAYDAVEATAAVTEALGKHPALFYFGTLIQRTLSGQAAVDHLLAGRHPDTRCLVDVNLRPGCYSRERVLRSLAAADILKLSGEERDEIIEICRSEKPEVRSIETMMEAFHIQMVALTLGGDGSRIYTRGKTAAAPATLPAPFVNSVGAGDGFAAILAFGLLKGWAPEKIIDAAAGFASGICSMEGAVPESGFLYEHFLKGVANGSGA